MDALMAALVAAFLIQITDRTPWRVAALGDRFADRAEVIAGILLALVVGNGVAAMAGTLIAPRLTPEARTLLLAVALLSAGIGAVLPVRERRVAASAAASAAASGGFGAAFLTMLVLALGDRTQFVTAALAARSPLPWLAPVGAVLGGMIVLVPVTLGGRAMLARLPMAALRLAIGGVLLLTGIASALLALQLI